MSPNMACSSGPLRQLLAPRTLRSFSTASPLASSSRSPPSPYSRPAPIPLPPADQRDFERLVQRAQAPLASIELDAAEETVATIGKDDAEEVAMHPDLRRKPKPDFEGDTNPATGEVGGPKKDPLQWEREWTYGGRATDF